MGVKIRTTNSFKSLKKKAELISFDAEKTIDTVHEEDNTYGFITDDFSYAKQYAANNPDLFVYTLIEEDGKAYIIDGWHFVNRIGYLFGKNDVKNVQVRWW